MGERTQQLQARLSGRLPGVWIKLRWARHHFHRWDKEIWKTSFTPEASRSLVHSEVHSNASTGNRQCCPLNLTSGLSFLWFFSPVAPRGRDPVYYHSFTAELNANQSISYTVFKGTYCKWHLSLCSQQNLIKSQSWSGNFGAPWTLRSKHSSNLFHVKVSLLVWIARKCSLPVAL